MRIEFVSFLLYFRENLRVMGGKACPYISIYALGVGDGRSLGSAPEGAVVELGVLERIDGIGIAVVVGQLDADAVIDFLVVVEHVLGSHKAASEACFRVKLDLGLLGH